MTTQDKKTWLMDKLADKNAETLYRDTYRPQYGDGYYAEVEPPITLARVLLMMKKLYPINLVVSIGGEYWDEGEEKFERHALGLMRRWNLSHDSLEDQSDETIEYLFNIFKDE